MSGTTTGAKGEEGLAEMVARRGVVLLLLPTPPQLVTPTCQ